LAKKEFFQLVHEIDINSNIIEYKMLSKIILLICCLVIIHSEKTIISFKSSSCAILANDYKAKVFSNSNEVIYLEHLGYMIVDMNTHDLMNAVNEVHEFHECVDKVYPDMEVKIDDPIIHDMDENFVYPSWQLRRMNVRNPPIPDTFSRQIPPVGTHSHVYILDSGIDNVNEDLIDKLAPDDQHKSYVQSDSCCTTSYDPLCDCNSHGTHCAGLVASPKAGYNINNAQLHSVKVFDINGSSSYSVILQAMNLVVVFKNLYHPNQLTIASMSLSGPIYSLVNSAVGTLFDNGVLVVVAAGNSDADACNSSPASAAKALTVGASDIYDARAYFSNYGDCVKIFAPGTYIYSTKPGSGYKYMSGTSMSTPFIAGYASYIGSFLNSTNPQEVIDEINKRATKGIVTNALSAANNLPFDGTTTMINELINSLEFLR
jgi:hypothetical protein